MSDSKSWYVGVDVGGTKICAGLVDDSGIVRYRTRSATPRDVSGKNCCTAIGDVIKTLLASTPYEVTDLRGIGIAVPGIASPDDDTIGLTPNMPLTGMRLGPQISARFSVPVACFNDVNMGTLGEYACGAARNAQSVVGIFVGTGIGGGLIINGKSVDGAHHAAGEIGHIIVNPDGPLCGCGMHGCVEAYASRTAIERDIRAAVASGQKSSVFENIDTEDELIRSKALRRALREDDAVVTKVMRDASEVLGRLCVLVQRLIDPEVIVLGGGVIDACESFVMPIIHATVKRYRLGESAPVRIASAALGDDAVLCGAVAALRQREDAGNSDASGHLFSAPRYVPVMMQDNNLRVGDATYPLGICVRVAGEIKNIKNARPDAVGYKDVRRACKGGVAHLFIGSAVGKDCRVTSDAQTFLSTRGVAYTCNTYAAACEAYNAASERRALLLTGEGVE